MSRFVDDVRDQVRVVRAVGAALRAGAPRTPQREAVDRAVRLLGHERSEPIVLVGMGSSHAAALALPPVLAHDRTVLVHDAGELLHYGIAGLARLPALVCVSQSGRSMETVAVAEHLRAAGTTRIIAVVNEPDSPLADLADVVVPLEAGDEQTVATKTYAATIVALLALAETLSGRPLGLEAIPAIASAMARQAADPEVAPAAGAHLGRSRALIVIARGPAYSAAAYAALTCKETAALPAEAMTGAAFRHGPLELTETDVGLVVLAPAGSTRALSIRLALEVAGLGRPVWLLASDGEDLPGSEPGRLLATRIPRVPEPLAPLACIVPLQLAAAELARARGREAGVTVRATKVTTIE